MEVNIDIKKPGALVSAYVESPFDEGKEVLEKERYKIISLRDNAMLRIQEGKDSFVSKNGNYTIEDLIYTPQKGIYLTKKPSIMQNAKEATEGHRNGKEYYLTSNQLEEALSDSILMPNKAIPTNRFKEEELTVYAFENYAEQYGYFLREEVGINKLEICLTNAKEKPFARKMWFFKLSLISGFNGLDNRLHKNNMIRAIKSAEDIEKNFATELRDYMHLAV